jgi:hypothetical protein
MSSVTSTSATITYPTSIPTGTISALIGQPPNTTNDYYIVNYLLLAFGRTSSPLKGIVIPPLKPDNYVFTTRGPSILAGMSITIAIMVIITVARLVVRFCGRGLVFGLDDLFIVPGALLAITWPSLQIMAVIYGGAGKHIWDVTYEEYGYFKRYTNLSKVIFFVSVGIVKVSICFFNRRLTSMTSRTWLWFNNIFLVLLFIYIMVSLFWDIFSCSPAYAGWDPIRIGRENIKPKCFSVSILGTVLSTIHVVMDFGLLAVPLIVLWKVKMGWKTKSRLYFVFSIGMMSAVGSIFRQIEQGKLGADVLCKCTYFSSSRHGAGKSSQVGEKLQRLSVFLDWKMMVDYAHDFSNPFAKISCTASANQLLDPKMPNRPDLSAPQDSQI